MEFILCRASGEHPFVHTRIVVTVMHVKSCTLIPHFKVRAFFAACLNGLRLCLHGGIWKHDLLQQTQLVHNLTHLSCNFLAARRILHILSDVRLLSVRGIYFPIGHALLFSRAVLGWIGPTDFIPALPHFCEECVQECGCTRSRGSI